MNQPPALRDQLRQLGIRPQSALASFVERARMRGARKQAEAAADFVYALEHLRTAMDALGQADLRYNRTMRLLADADKIYDMDAEERQKNLVQAREARLDAEHRAQLRAWEREEELEQARARHAQRKGYADTEVVEEPNRAAHEFRADFDMTKAVAQARAETQAVYDEFVSKHGGWDNMSDELKARADALKEKLEALIKESGFG